MASIGWLHLTDLHLGLTGQKWLWPTVREQFYKDLERLHAKSGPWDLVLFTGDLTQRGTKEEFDKLTETFGKLWIHLAKLGSKPALVTVPGNHDLQRPKVNPTVRALRDWNDDPTLREEFWTSTSNQYRKVVGKAFAAYENFVRAHPPPADFKVSHGTLPGDRSISLERNGLKLALVGLNTAFLQLEGGDYQGKLDLDVRQLHGVCGDDPPEWLADHHAALLLTHHPTTWLHPRALANFKAEIAPPGRFVAHLFGHMHESGATSLSVSGSSPQRGVQGTSLFGLETWGDGTEDRIHGYMAGRISVEATQGEFTLWPRALGKNRAGAWQMTPDVSFELHDDAVVEVLENRRFSRFVRGAGTTPQRDNEAGNTPPIEIQQVGASVGPPNVVTAVPGGSNTGAARSSTTASPRKPLVIDVAPTVFFANRLGSAFPGVRGLDWFNDPRDAIDRLKLLLHQPLKFDKSTAYNGDREPIWYWRGVSGLGVSSFVELEDGRCLMDCDELKIERVAVYRSSHYARSFVYVEAGGEAPTGVYNWEAGAIDQAVEDSGYAYEEYALFRGIAISRGCHDDGAAVIGGKVVNTRGSELRLRYLSRYNFALAAKYSPFNSRGFSAGSEAIFRRLLKGEDCIRELCDLAERLPHHRRDV